jgi:outer membrane murein-binding lipoprotein Lpp
MINTLKIFNDLKQTMDPTAAEKIVDVITSVYEELQNSVTKVEFNELKEIVKDLAGQVSNLTKRMGELTQRVDTLAVRMDELTQRVDTLAIRMDELTANVSRLERKVEDLVGEMKGIKVTIQDMRQEIGGMSHAIGYGLEDQSYLTLPPILQRDHAITLKGRLKRGFLETGRNKYIEINIWGQGEREGKSIEIIGEAKTQLKKRDVDKFLQTIQAIQPHIDHSIHPICITYQTSPAVIHYAKEKGITLYFTYELQSG